MSETELKENTDAQLAEKIIEIIANKLDKNPQDIKWESRLIEDLGADSLDITELVMYLEEDCQVDFEADGIDIAEIKTVGQVIEMIKKLKP